MTLLLHLQYMEELNIMSYEKSNCDVLQSWYMKIQKRFLSWDSVYGMNAPIRLYSFEGIM